MLKHVERVVFLAVLSLLTLVSCEVQEYKVGMTTRAFIPAGDYDWRGASAHALITTIWYPAVADAVEQDIGLPPGPGAVWDAGRAAIDAPAFDAPKRSFPLIVLSHGDGSSGKLLAWMAIGLVKRGFVVAAVEHPGNNSMEPVTLEGFALRWKRALDLSAVIDGVLDDPVFGDVVDPRRIGAAGHSMGGYSVIELAGGRTDLQAFGQYCANSPPEACAPPPNRVDFVTYVQQVAQDPSIDPELFEELTHAGDSYLDERVGAIYAMAPPFGFSFDAASLSAISIPVEVVVGDADALAPAQWNAQYYVDGINAGKTHENAELDLLTGGVGHFVFLDLPTQLGKMVLPPELALDLPGVDRAAVHEDVVESALEFFCKGLRVRSPRVGCFDHPGHGH